ncbi:M15 family metallopeptidase [Actinopolymorpha sp. NPDC004070]|uniref:M15 family metallopeptidase n=1 Tax=Actinopolymorpha sp. NPDC004070 TaxID=3154548 RepID=UPI0033A72093
MNHRTSRPAPAHPAGRVVLVGLAILGVTVAAFLMRRSLETASHPSNMSNTATTTSTTAGSNGPNGPNGPSGPSGPSGSSPTAEVRRLPTGPRAHTALGSDDGVVPDGTTVSVFDQAVPAVGRLDPDLLAALRGAARAAEAAGVRMHVDSGWRSPEYQQRLLDDAVAEYGSLEKAARWVATPQTSAHVLGEAVDLGPYAATAWLSRHGAAYGLCQIYANESWHYELRPDAVGDGCPAMYADPTEDPRMRR